MPPVSAEYLREKEHEHWLQDQCVRLRPRGICNIYNCLKRGGYERGNPNDTTYEDATCIPYEIYKRLGYAGEGS